MAIVVKKLKFLKAELKGWNSDLFGNFCHQVNSAKEELESLKLNISQNGFSADKFQQEVSAQEKLNDALSRQLEFLHEKAGIKWLEDGDPNTSYFHSVINVRRADNSIKMLKIDGSYCWDPNVIQDHILNYYSEQFSQDDQVESNINISGQIIS